VKDRVKTLKSVELTTTEWGSTSGLRHGIQERPYTAVDDLIDCPIKASVGIALAPAREKTKFHAWHLRSLIFDQPSGRLLKAANFLKYAENVPLLGIASGPTIST